MKKIELKDAAGKETVKRETRRFALMGRNVGVLEFTKEEIKKGEFKNSEISKINSNIKALAKNIENFANWFYTLDETSEKDFLLFYKVVELIEDKKGIVFGFVERISPEFQRNPLTYTPYQFGISEKSLDLYSVSVRQFIPIISKILKYNT